MTVTIIGDSFIDIIVPVFNIKSGNTYQRDIVISCGGTANVAMQISKLGEKAKFIGKIGNDAFGSYFKENLKSNNVKDLTFVDDSRMTGLCISLVDENGERSMITSRGTNDSLTKREIESYINEVLESKIVYFSGYSLLSKQSSESIIYAMEESNEHNCEIYFNPGAPNIITKLFKKIIYNFVDVLILNIEEARKITDKSKVHGILSILDTIVSTTIITMGNDGCVISKDGKHALVPSNNVENVVDTTGAGDAFSAGFIVGKLCNMDTIECAKMGHDVAANFLKEKRRLIL